MAENTINPAKTPPTIKGLIELSLEPPFSTESTGFKFGVMVGSMVGVVDV